MFCLDPVTGELRAAADDSVKPNGIAFSPDEKILAVADTGASDDPDGSRHIRAFDVTDKGKLRGAASSPPATLACPTASASTPPAASGAAPATASIAS